MYRIVICDDETASQREIKALASRLMERLGEPCTIQCVASPAQLMSAREAGARWDLILLDIVMDGPTGLTLARQLRADGDETDVVFVTNCAEYALEGYRAYPVNFLIKPLTHQTLLPVLERCLSRWRQEPMVQIYTGEGGSVAVPVGEIRYIEVFRRELVIHSAAGNVTGTGSLAALMEQLPGKRFYRSHRSYLVNLDYVAGIRHYQFLLKDGQSVPISMRMYPKAQQHWLDYLV